MMPLFQEILSLVWVFAKQSDQESLALDGETCLFFEKTIKKTSLDTGTSPPSQAPQAPLSRGLNSIKTKSVIEPLPQQIDRTVQKRSDALSTSPKDTKEVAPSIQTETAEKTLEETQPLPPPLLNKHEKLLPRPFAYTPPDTFQVRKNIQATPQMPRLCDGCLYKTEERKSVTWSFFSFPLPRQEELFLESVMSAVKTRLQKKVLQYSCLDPSFVADLSLCASDSEKIFFFIEPHNESSLRKSLEAIPLFVATPTREVDPFLSLGSIERNPLLLFPITPGTSSSTETKTRLWNAFKKLAAETMPHE